jgi:hypothetical protein
MEEQHDVDPQVNAFMYYLSAQPQYNGNAKGIVHSAMLIDILDKNPLLCKRILTNPIKDTHDEVYNLIYQYITEKATIDRKHRKNRAYKTNHAIRKLREFLERFQAKELSERHGLEKDLQD